MAAAVTTKASHFSSIAYTLTSSTTISTSIHLIVHGFDNPPKIPVDSYLPLGPLLALQRLDLLVLAWLFSVLTFEAGTRQCCVLHLFPSIVRMFCRVCTTTMAQRSFSAQRWRSVPFLSILAFQVSLNWLVQDSERIDGEWIPPNCTLALRPLSVSYQTCPLIAILVLIACVYHLAYWQFQTTDTLTNYLRSQAMKP